MENTKNKELDIKLKEAGLLTVEQLMKSPAHPLFMHSGVVDLRSLQQWAKMRYEESLRLKARVQLEEGILSESYLAEWAIAFSAVFGEVHHHLTKILGDVDELR